MFFQMGLFEMMGAIPVPLDSGEGRMDNFEGRVAGCVTRNLLNIAHNLRGGHDTEKRGDFRAIIRGEYHPRNANSVPVKLG